MSSTQASYNFDPRGNLLWSDAGQGRTSYTYDEKNRLKAAVYPDGRVLGLEYDRNGNLVRRRSPGGALQRFAYDSQGRVVEAYFGGEASLASRYDEADRLVEAQSPGCATRYLYACDPDGASNTTNRPIRCEQTVQVDGLSALSTAAEFSYDSENRLAGARVSGFDAWLRYAYDDQGRLISLGCDGIPDLVRVEYTSEAIPNAGPQEVHLHFANGVTQGFSMDGRFRIRQIRAALPGGEAFLDLNYRSRPDGSITAVNEQRFLYDRQGRLIEYGPLLGKRTRYLYDDAGNRLEASLVGEIHCDYHYDRPGRLTGWRRPNGARVRCGYDSEGSLIRRIDDRLRWAYRNDAAGRMVHAACNGRTVAQYGYDHMGRRVLNVHRAEKGHDDKIVVLQRDPWGNLLAETTPGGETRVYLGLSGRPLVCLAARGDQVKAFFLHPDHLGSLRAVTGEDGNVLSRVDFDPFGSPRTPESSSYPLYPADLPLVIFAGHSLDPGLGIYDAGVRLYDPEVGRFTSPDPYTFSAEDPRLLWLAAPEQTRRRLRDQQLKAWQRNGALLNRYVYALNSPLTYVDRDGHSAGLYFLYTLLAIFWALPYTLVGFIFFEVYLNWITLAFLWDKNHQLKGQSSGRLSAWSLWSIGGLGGRFADGFTMGNFVIMNGDLWNRLDDKSKTFGIPVRHKEIYPPVDANNLLTERKSVVEHELRHTNQYGWWGPFWIPGILVGFFLFQNLILTGISALTKDQLNLSWKEILDALKDKWLLKLAIGVPPLLGVYFWDLILNGGYGGSSFEKGAALYSGTSDNINVQVSASASGVSPGGEVIVSAITSPDRMSSLNLTISTNSSGGATLLDRTPETPITNLLVYRYTAGPKKGKDVLTATDGSGSATVEIEVK